jgi:hypothetical protein
MPSGMAGCLPPDRRGPCARPGVTGCRGRAADPDAEALQALIREAGAGVLHVDHLLAIGRYFGGRREEVVLLEAEPGGATTGEQLSAEGARILRDMIEAARREALAPRPAARAGT